MFINWLAGRPVCCAPREYRPYRRSGRRWSLRPGYVRDWRLLVERARHALLSYPGCGVAWRCLVGRERATPQEQQQPSISPRPLPLHFPAPVSPGRHFTRPGLKSTSRNHTVLPIFTHKFLVSIELDVTN